jgi:hypothetical protein
MFIGQVTVEVPFKGAGNTVLNNDVSFKVSRENELYKASPILTAAELRVANLPAEIDFTVANGKVTSGRGPRDTNLHVWQAIYDKLSVESA